MQKESLNRINEIRRLSNSYLREDTSSKWFLVREELLWIENKLLSDVQFSLSNYLLSNPEMGHLLKSQIEANRLINSSIHL